uniref:VWA domain-containing protein n=1 Tax=Marinobacterium profundum TaxID=1714300 RepID=UPI00082A3808|nr:VWA domain-containing protein [Marinobacterium profundum]
MIEAFHFLRPLWLLLLVPVALLGYRLWQQQALGSGWQRLIPASLLQPLLEQQPGQQRRAPLLALGAAWLTATVALAGPSWEQLPQPVYQPQASLVVILDLSPSMLAQDLKPSRLMQARLRMIDLLRARQEGLTALVVYAGDAHLVSPLSQDRQTLLALAPTLSPDIMPIRGSQVEAAVERALALLNESGHGDGQLLLITDGVTPAAADAVAAQLQASGLRLSILGVGTPEGAPIPSDDGSFARDSAGRMILAKLDAQPLIRLARDSGGIYRALSSSASELDDFSAQFAQPRIVSAQQGQLPLGQSFDQWREAGPWLVLLLLPVAALAFRRGWLLSLLLVCLITPSLAPLPAVAAETSPSTGNSTANTTGAAQATDAGIAEISRDLWRGLWSTADQQGAAQFQAQQFDQAAGHFRDPAWLGSARYRSGDFSGASDSFRDAIAQQDSAANHYNLGNALAQGGQLKEALDAYKQALQRNPQLADAQANRDLVEQLLQKQEQGQQQSSQSDQNQDDNQDQSQNPQQGQEQQDNQSGAQQPGNESQQGDSDPQADSQPQDGGSESTPESEADNPTDKGSSKHDQNSTDQPEANADKATGSETNKNAKQAPGDDQNEVATGTEPSPQRSQELERWLRQLPDDPGGLLRRKFEYEYQQKLEAYRQGRWTPPEETRW